MENNKKTLKDIFDDDDLGILNTISKASGEKTEDERLVESFKEISDFYEKNNREPNQSGVTEFKLYSRLKGLRQDEKKIQVLRPFDKFDLFGELKAPPASVQDILSDDEFGILDTDETLSIFKITNIPKDREDPEYVARRKPLKEFEPYEPIFKAVHRDLRERKRKLVEFRDENLQEGNFYVLDGVLLFVEKLDVATSETALPSGNRTRKDGRTRCIFENGTESNMLYRSLAKQLYVNGKAVTKNSDTDESELFSNLNLVNEEDIETGWIYILKSKSKKSEISVLNDLFKIGYSKIAVTERIKNALKEPTYLMDEVSIVATYKCYNLNPQKFEQLIHRFFGKVCLNVDLYDERRRRYTPREWFIVPLGVIEKTIELILSGDIVNYEYDEINQKIVLK